MVKKNTSYHVFAITVSPLSGSQTPQNLTDAIIMYKEMKKKSIVKIAWCVEQGKNLDHPHIHILIELNSPRRRDTYKTSCQKFFSKVLDHPISRPFVVLKIAYNPIYYLQEYMTKESVVINHGFVLENIKKELRESKYKYLKMGTHLKPLTRTNISMVYDELIQQEDLIDEIQYVKDSKVTSRPTRQSPALIFDKFLKLLDENNFNIGWCFWNTSQILKLII